MNVGTEMFLGVSVPLAPTPLKLRPDGAYGDIYKLDYYYYLLQFHAAINEYSPSRHDLRQRLIPSSSHGCLFNPAVPLPPSAVPSTAAPTTGCAPRRRRRNVTPDDRK